jgi:hypothetical protein
MKKNLLLFRSMGIIIALFFCCATGCGKNSKISDEERAFVEEAIQYGIEAKGMPFLQVTKPWTIDLGYDQTKGFATYCSPFLRLALLGKNSAEKNQSIPEPVIAKILRDNKGSLHFFINLYGDEPAYAKRLEFFLKHGEKTLLPIKKSIPNYSEFSRDYMNIVKGELYFSNEGIGKNDTVTLVVKINPSSEDQDHSHNHHDHNHSHTVPAKTPVEPEPIRFTEFTFDLSQYR